MKKALSTIVSLLMLAAFALCLAACGGSGSNAEKTFDVNELAKSIYENCSFDDTGLALTPNPEFTVCTVYGADAALIAGEEGAKKAAAYVTASPEMIICIEAVDAASAQKLMAEAMEPVIETYIHDYSNYSPAEVSKLESAVKIVEGKYVIVAVTADNAAAETYINGLLGK